MEKQDEVIAMDNMGNSIRFMKDLPPDQSEWLMRHIAEREALRGRWQQIIFKTAVTFLSVCAPLIVALMGCVGGCVLWLLKGTVLAIGISVLSGVVVMQADLHTKSKFVNKIAALMQGKTSEAFAKYAWYEVACLYVMISSFVVAVLLLLVAIFCI